MRRLRRKWLLTLDRIGRSPWLSVVAAAWVLVVLAFFGLQLDMYEGLTSSLAEWQYSYLGQYLPWLTFLALFAMCTLPVVLVLAYLRHRVRRALAPEVPALVHTVMRAETAMLNFLSVCASAVLLIGFGVFVWTMFFPQMQTPDRAITVAAAAVPAPGNGNVRLTGTVLYGRTAKYQQDVMLIERVMYFAPVAQASSEAGAGQFFVELPNSTPPSGPQARLATFNGILVRDGLPGPIRQLYKAVGINVTEQHYVLFTSRVSLCWPYYVVALNCLVMGLILTILALFQRKRLKTISRRAAEAQLTSLEPSAI